MRVERAEELPAVAKEQLAVVPVSVVPVSVVAAVSVGEPGEPDPTASYALLVVEAAWTLTWLVVVAAEAAAAVGRSHELAAVTGVVEPPAQGLALAH